MKLTSIILTACLLAVPLGCKTAATTTPTAALAPGYLNPQDQAMGQMLSGVHNFITSMQAQITAGYVPGPTEKTALNALIATTSAADATYLAFHKGTATQAAAQTAINKAYLQQQTMATSVQGGK